MKLTFLGTRGNIDASTRRHRYHTSLLVGYLGGKIMVDCGGDWTGKLATISPDAIVVTHAHPDHAWALREEAAPSPVYASEESWRSMKSCRVEQRRLLSTARSLDIAGMRVRAFTVEHSLRAPAVGLQVTAGDVRIFYAPDLVYIHERSRALDGVRLYIGDGATLTRSFVRKRGDSLIGHTPFRTQITWCGKEGVEEAIVTHCGTEIVTGDERRLGAKLREMARERGVKARIAHDGMEMVLRS